MAALVNQGDRHPAFYWVYGVAATLIALAVWAGRSAVREDWQELAISVAIMLVAAASALTDPRAMWLSDGVGCCAVLVANAVRWRGCSAHGQAHDGRRHMTAEALDPLIHVPARLQIMATLAALPNGDQLSFTRLQDMIGLTAGNLITHLRRLGDAGYVTTEKTGSGPASRTSVALTLRGRAAFDLYTARLRELLNGL